MFACIFASSATGILRSVSPEALIQLAFCFSPRVEPIAPDTVILDIEGLRQLFGSPEELAQKIMHRASESAFQVNISIARNTAAAIHAARGFTGITVIPPGQEASILSGLPLHLLSANPEMEQTWKLWGLKTFGDLAALPETGIAERLGPEGARLHRIARGAEHRPLIPFIPAPDFQAAAELEHPIELLEPLAFILASLLNQLCASLDAGGLAARGIRLRLKLQNPAENFPSDFERHLSLPVPLRDGMALLKLLRLDLESHPPQAPIIAVSIRAEPAPPRVIQNSLFLPPVPEPEKLELTLARIVKLVGAGNVGSPDLMDTHRPGAFQIRPFRITASQPKLSRDRSWNRLSFRAFRPPLRAEVESSLGRPVRVRARGMGGKVISLAGPWRSSGDWWSLELWDRDEWDVELEPFSRKPKGRKTPQSSAIDTVAHPRHCLYRIYCDLRTGSWHVEGSYD